MGPRTVRFTAEDFVIPAEMSGLRLAESSAGQIGGVHLNLIEANGQTDFGPIFQQVPLRVLPPFHFAGEPALVYLLNPTAGLLDGDGHKVEISAGSGISALVTGQSATRIHPAVHGFSTQQWQVRAGEDAQLVLLPGPNIPYRGSRYFQKAAIELDEGARLIWGDIWTPGRYARIGALAEHYVFERIVQELEVRRQGELVYRDRFNWQGPWDGNQARWYLGGGLSDAIGSLFITGEVEFTPLNDDGPLRRAVLPLAHGDTLVRWCGPVADVTGEVVRTALGVAARWSGRSETRPWLIGSHHLAPSHWFSVQLERRSYADGSS
jgi:urease accessory protein